MLYHKIADSPIYEGMKSRFTMKKPFDCIVFSKCSAYVVIWFYEPRKQKEFILIDIDDYLIFKSKHEMKSFTKDEAYKIGQVIRMPKEKK